MESCVAPQSQNIGGITETVFNEHRSLWLILTLLRSYGAVTIQ